MPDAYGTSDMIPKLHARRILHSVTSEHSVTHQTVNAKVRTRLERDHRKMYCVTFDLCIV